MAAWRLLSTPLPPLPGFLNPYPSFRNLESGSDSNSNSNVDVDFDFDVESGNGTGTPLSSPRAGEGAGKEGRILESIGGAVEFVAGRLAGLLADVVGDGEVEGGLVLPVRDEEREHRSTAFDEVFVAIGGLEV